MLITLMTRIRKPSRSSVMYDRTDACFVNSNEVKEQLQEMKEQLQEACLPKISIPGQIVFEILFQLCPDDCTQILVNLTQPRPQGAFP